MLKYGIHAASSTNCIWLVPVSKPVNNGMVTSTPSTEVTSAIIRCSGAFRSEPVASTTKPPIIGTQIARLRRGIPVIVYFRLWRP